MGVYKVASASDIVDSIFEEFEDIHNTNDYGEKCSSYFVIAWNESLEKTISISVTRESNGIPVDEQFYSIHVIDEIDDRDCDLHSTNDTKRTSLLKEISELITSNIY